MWESMIAEKELNMAIDYSNSFCTLVNWSESESESV
jgi:hypothetical protein